jgi:hypothetical protein
VPCFATPAVPLRRSLTERGTQYCGSPDPHVDELYLAVENSDQTRTKVKSPQTQGIGERCPKTVLPECYRIAFRKKISPSLADLQAACDRGLKEYHAGRPHPGRWCDGKTPRQPFVDPRPLAKEKVCAAYGYRTRKRNLTTRTKITLCQIKY